MILTDISLNPEQSVSNAEAGRLLEEAILNLPDHYRSVLVLRDVEELSTAETAETLGLTEQNVKVRLHRGRALLIQKLTGGAKVEAGNEAIDPSRCLA